jgi:hypothetical protein
MSLPIRKLTLYKQGIGYFERRGEFDGKTTTLVIPREATNDALKSLNVVVHGGKPALSIDYETPEDKAKVLAQIPIRLSDRGSMVDLLTSLRGSRVVLRLDNGQTESGRLVGVEASLEAASQPPAVLLQGETDSSMLQSVPIGHVRGLQLLDERATTDVSFFLDVSRTEQTRTTLTVRLPEGEHDLEISYLAPSPTWRVSYRIVSDGANTARLMAWGLFDNSLDEDLEEVTLTLVSGRPISFQYGLYQSRTPTRPQVSDDPMSLESLSGDPRIVEAISTISHDLRSPLSSIVGAVGLLPELGALTDEQANIVRIVQDSGKRMTDLIGSLLDIVRLREDRSDLRSSTASLFRSGPLGDLKVSGSYFMPLLMGNAEPEYMTYHVNTPISVRRGQSAMVPIVDTSLPYQELCVYNGDKMPNHPLLVWRFQDTTGLALEQGPVTIIQGDAYAGEGLMRFTGSGDDIQIPYALEYGILVSERMEQDNRQLAGVRFVSEQRKAVVSRSQITEYIYRLSSRVNRSIRVFIERRDPNQGKYYEMPPPDLALGGTPAGVSMCYLMRNLNISCGCKVLMKIWKM